MSLHPSDAERILRARLGAPINPVPHGEREGADNDKVMGFSTVGGKVLALNRKIAFETHIWFEPPQPPALDGVSLRDQPTINSNLSGPLAVLNRRSGLQAEVQTEAALHRFLDWYGPRSRSAAADTAAQPELDLAAFREALNRFRRLIEHNSGGRAFAGFREGLAAAWESYKPRLHDHALGVLDPASWKASEVGSGGILERTIAAIEIEEPRKNLRNNLVFWQNRYGHANRAHRALLEARADASMRIEIERQLFGLFQGGIGEAAAFDRLAELTHAKYPLLAYLFFLRDADRFMPILPSVFDKAFRELNVDLVTQRNCSWENYTRFNAALGQICDALKRVGGVGDARLIDAHSFCWMLERLDQPGPGADGKVGRRSADAGRIFGPFEKSIWEMKDAVLQTVKHARGQLEERRVKLKELRMSESELEALIKALLERQENRCALTGLPFQFRGEHNDVNMLPSLDRIDSNGHYEKGNLQVVCRFVNFWKQDADNEEFKRLLMLVRGLEE